MEKNEHEYYWAWLYEDNPTHSYLRGMPEWYRVFRADTVAPVTEPMSRDEAIAECARIVKLTGGRQL